MTEPAKTPDELELLSRAVLMSQEMKTAAAEAFRDMTTRFSHAVNLVDEIVSSAAWVADRSALARQRAELRAELVRLREVLDDRRAWIRFAFVITDGSRRPPCSRSSV